MRRPNFTALALSALIVLGGPVAMLRWQPVLPGLGMMDAGGGSVSDMRREAPPAGRGCAEDREVAHGGYRFLPGCAGQVGSFEGRYFVVKNPGWRTGVGLVQGGSGASLDDLDTLDDGQPFAVFWSPVAQRFFVNHQVAEQAERFRLFEVRGGGLSERRALGEAAAAVLLARRRCLTPQDVSVSGMRWSRDGGRVALLAYARREACNGLGNWRPLWMIGEVDSGRIDPGSIRSRSGRDPLPGDGPYAAF